MRWLLLLLLSVNVFASETRTRIAILDTGYTLNAITAPYLCKTGHYDATGMGFGDFIGHGTNVAGLIARFVSPKTHCFMVMKFFHTSDLNTGFSTLIDVAVDNGAKFINISAYETMQDLRAFASIKRAIRKGVYVVVAAGNDGVNLNTNCYLWPACFDFQSRYFKVVGNFIGLMRAPTSNYGGTVNTLEDGEDQTAWGITYSGTSQAAAIVTGKLAAKLPVRCAGNVCYK